LKHGGRTAIVAPSKQVTFRLWADILSGCRVQRCFVWLPSAEFSRLARSMISRVWSIYMTFGYPSKSPRLNMETQDSSTPYSNQEAYPRISFQNRWYAMHYHDARANVTGCWKTVAHDPEIQEFSQIQVEVPPCEVGGEHFYQVVNRLS
jgi:hypothetical protein